MIKIKKTIAAGLASLLCLGTLFTKPDISVKTTDLKAYAASEITLSDMPDEYQYAADWIWNNRITNEDSTGSKGGRYNSLFDQIIDGKGTINYVVRWQSYRTVTLEQRRQFETMLSKGINDWNKWLAGYEDWPYDHIDVKIVGWAVIDESCLLDLQPDEIVYTNTTYYDSQYDTSNGYETIPDKLPNAPDELSRMEHFSDKNYQYPGGLDKRFDMYMWATQGFPAIGGCGGDWGQRLSDTAYLNMLDGTGIHVFEHELGHGFGMTDFYGGEGESDGFPPGGFPGDGTSLMMAGSSSVITDFDGWMLRYMWSKIKYDSGRFDLSEQPQTPTNPVTTTTTTTTTPVTTTTTTTVKPVNPGENESVLSVTYDSNNNYWLIDTNGAAHITIQAQGLPYAALSGIYGYWDNNSEKWIQDDWMMPESLGPEGISTFTVDIPENEYTTQIQIQVHYYAQWDNDANGMEDKDPTGVLFSAVGSGKAQIVTTPVNTAITTTTTTTTSTTVPVTTETEPPVVTDLSGDVNANGVFNISDIVMMQKWLLGIGNLADWKAGDVYEDDVINVFDLCLMRRLLISAQ